jgi:hypothetical protein
MFVVMVMGDGMQEHIKVQGSLEGWNDYCKNKKES